MRSTGGELVIRPRAGLEHGEMAMGAGAVLPAFVRQNGLGTVTAAETGFVLRQGPDVVRAPDVASTSAARRARVGDATGFSEVPPDLAVDVLSPSESGATIVRKVAQYLEAGVRSVWVIDQGRGSLTIYATDGPPRTLTEPDAVVHDPVLPGFACRLAELLPPRAASGAHGGA